MPKGWTDTDPDKGKPYRHTRAKIRLLLADIAGDAAALEKLVMRLAEKRPDDVLDAMVWLCRDDDDENHLLRLTPREAEQLERAMDGDGPAVCVTHLRFVPCRKRQGCVTSVLPADVERVRAFQEGRDDLSVPEDNKSTAR